MVETGVQMVFSWRGHVVAKAAAPYARKVVPKALRSIVGRPN